MVWQQLAIEAGLEVGLFIIHNFIDRQPDPPKPAVFDLSRIDEGSPIPYVYGRVRINSPIMIWQGNAEHRSLAPNFPEAFAYGISMAFVLGTPMWDAGFNTGGGGTNVYSAMMGLWIGDQRRSGADSIGPEILDGTLDLVLGAFGPNCKSQFNDFARLGGPGSGGGIGGYVSFLNGRSDQFVTNYPLSTFVTTAGSTPLDVELQIAGVDRSIVPAYRNQMLLTMVMRPTLPMPDGSLLAGVGETPRVPQIAVEIATGCEGRPGTEQVLANDANPAKVIFDIITSPVWKLGVPMSDIDITSFSNCAATLLGEAHGYSAIHYQTEDAVQIIGRILAQIDGLVYQDPSTGLITMRLIRKDYNPLSLPTIDQTNTVGRPEYSTTGWRETFNQVRVNYTNRDDNYTQGSITAQRLGNVYGQDNRLRSTTVEYPGCCTAKLAQKLAARDLAVMSRPLAKATCTVSRAFFATVPGDVVKVSWPQYGVVGKIMRVMQVDQGQLADGGVRLTLVEDVFDQTVGSFVAPPSTKISLYAEPLTKRKLTEAAYWFMYWTWQTGLISSPDVQRIFALAAPDDASTSYGVSSSDTGTNLQPEFTAGFPLSAKVHAAYGRELDPYDTSTGLVLDTLTNGQTPASLVLNGSYTATGIRANGPSLILVGDEIMAYESATDIGSGVVRLNNIWRGLLDTAPRDHAIGDRVFWIGTSFFGLDFVGRRGWAQIAGLKVKEMPRLGVRDDGGANNVDTINIQGRGNQPARVADLVLCGEVMAGTQGIPAVAAPAGQLGTFKKVTSLEEGFGYAFKKRDRKLVSISRGDDADETPSDTDPTTWDVFAQKVRSGQTPSTATADAEVAIRTALGAANTGDAAQLGAAGYGDIDVIAHTRRTKPAGGGGVIAQVVYSEWDAPKVRVRAERWRNLVANARFDFHGAGTNIAPGWVVSSGTPTIGQSASSITRAATDCYLGGSAAVTAVSTETFDVSGYQSRGMTARLEFYAHNAGTTTLTAVIAALDSGGSSLASTTVNGGAITPPTANWQRYSGTVVCPANTAQIRVTLTFTSVGGRNDAVVTEVCVRLGHAPQYDVLLNSSLDAALTSWTVDSGGFVNASTIASPSVGYAQGGAFAGSTMHQDYTIPAGYEVGGTAVLNLWRAQTLSGDSGNVSLSVLDGGGAVLAVVATGTETLAVLNQWYKRRLSVDLPTGAVKLRVLINANRTLGSGNSGACFDEVVVELHKDLGDPRYYRALTFDTPTVQPVVTTWQDWHLAYARSLFDAGIKDPDVICGYEPSLQNAANGFGLMWSDFIGSGFAPRANQPLYGNFGGGVGSMPAFQFARQSGVGALDLKSDNEGNGKFACPSLTSPFTVIAFIRVDEVGFASACGIAGRTGASSGSPGWGLEINAAGEAVGTLWGASATKSTSNAGAKVTDGALHMVGMAYDPIANTLTVVDEAHSTSISTVGMGEILNTTDSVVFRLGRSRDSIDTLPGMIGTFLRFDAAMTAAQMQAHWNYAKDPNGTALLISKSVATWSAGLPNASGATLVKLAANQLPQAYTTALTTDGGTGWGLAGSRGSTNLVPSFDYTSFNYAREAGVTLTQGVLDATGRPLGVTVVSPSTSSGFKMFGLPMTATATLQLQFYARAAAGTPTLNVELQNASNIVKQTLGVTLSTQWKLYTISFTLWDNSSVTARLRFISASGSTQFDLSSVMWAAQGTEIPTLWPDAASTLTDVQGALAETQLAQFNAEGELIVVGVATKSTPAVSTIADVTNGVSNKNARELLSDGTGKGELDHYDSVTPTNVTSKSTAFDWSQIWKVRGRWCSIGTLDNAATPFAGVVATASVSSAVYGRSAAWTYDATLGTTIRLGKGASGGSPLNCVLRSVVVRAREEKLV